MNHRVPVVLILVAACALATGAYAFSYNSVLANQFLQYSKVSYCSASQIKNWSCGESCAGVPGMKDITVISHTAQDAQAYAGYDSTNDVIVFAFRGSSNIINWYNNLRFEQVSYPGCSGCLVHEGFFDTYNSVKSTMLNAYSSIVAKRGKKAVVVTGHSLGGALAELFAGDLHAVAGTVNNLYTFGTPRVGNQALAQYLHSLVPNAVRVTHYHDPVPHVPPRQILGLEYLQVPTEVWYYTEAGSGTSYDVCTMPGVQEDPNCCDSVTLPTSVCDHLHYLGQYTGCSVDEDTCVSMTAELFGWKAAAQEKYYIKGMFEKMIKSIANE